MTGLPGLTELRSQNEPGLSIVTLVFNDGTPVYFARQIVSERLGDLQGRIPPPSTPPTPASPRPAWDSGRL